MVAGTAGGVRLRGGIDIERELMARAPLTLGTSVATTSGDLAADGVNLILHAVVFDDLGGNSRNDYIEKAVADALASAERHRARSVTITPVGSGVGVGRLAPADVYQIIVEVVGAYLRRNVSRIEQISVLCSGPGDIRTAFGYLKEARTLWWKLQSND